MDPSVRWDDGEGTARLPAWIPAFAGMTVMGWAKKAPTS